MNICCKVQETVDVSSGIGQTVGAIQGKNKEKGAGGGWRGGGGGGEWGWWWWWQVTG